jgi:acyl-CoA synthetase (AMP-forming)/AMP-acid ligase II
MLRRVQEHSINSISGVPSSFQMLLSLPLSSLRKIRKDLIWMEIGSAAMDKNFKLRLLKLFSKQIIAYHYGLTEASRSTVIDLKKDLNKIETVGKPFFGVKINICDKKKEIIKKINTIGEIVIEGSNVAKGYFNAHPKNFKKNRFYTGDLGSIDQNGYLTIHGRVDDLMNVGGVKISPTLIEKIINDKFPLNCEFVVYNSILKDKILGQRMALFVNKFIKKKNLITKINDTLLSNGIPSEGKIKDLFFINKFPKTINGKIKRQEISKNILTKINIHDHI